MGVFDRRWSFSALAYDPTSGDVQETLWVYAVHDETPAQPLNVEPVQLQDDAKLIWSWAEYPGQWLPETCTFKLRVRSAADLPAVEPGMWGAVSLGHPGTGQAICSFPGVFDDPDVEQDGRGLVMSLTLTNHLAQLAEVPVDAELDAGGNAIPWPAESLYARLFRIASQAKINLFLRGSYDTAAALGPVTPNNKGALSMFQECLAGAVYAGDQLVLRAGWYGGDFATDPLGSDLPGMDTMIIGHPDGIRARPYFYVDRVGRYSAMQAPFVMQAPANVLPGQATGPRVPVPVTKGDLPDLTGGAVLDANKVLRSSVKWTKSREPAVNQVKLTGVNAAGEQLSVVADYPELVQANGPNTRTVETQLLLTTTSDPLAAALLPDRATAHPDWTVDQFTVVVDAMTPEEVGQYAQDFYPVGQAPGPFHTMQLPVAIVNVAEVAQVAGGDLSGVLVGATFALSKGKLTITGQLRNEVLRPDGSLSGAVTWAQLRSEAVNGSPGVLWSTFTWHPAVGPPGSYTGAARTFDATAVDPSFDRDQLSWRDLRLMGVST